MIFLKEANFEDIDKQFDVITNMPPDENGFTNHDFGCTKKEFTEVILPRYINYSKGLDLPEGWVPATEYFLWDDDYIVGVFRIRHKLNEFLANTAGHVGYRICEEHRGKGYCSKGLELTIKKCWEIISEDEIYMSVYKSNPASLRVQIKNGAYVHHESDKEYFTRVPKE